MNHPFHPFAEEYPLMSATDLGRMEQDMRQGGFDDRFPIILFEGKILDGRNRETAATAAGIKPAYITFDGTEEEAKALVQRANEDRRHLQREWLEKRRTERIERVAKRRHEGASMPTIAKEEGVSLGQVQRDIEKAKSTLSPDKVEPEGGKVTGQDGKKRPAKLKPAAKPTPETQIPAADPQPETALPPAPIAYDEDDAPAPEPEAAPSPVDHVGAPIPPALLPVFADDYRLILNDALRLIREAADKVDELARIPGGAQLRMHLSHEGPNELKMRFKLNDLTNATRALKHWQPYSAYCPYCVHEGKVDRKCPACFGHGWTCKDAFEAAPRDYQATIKLMGYGEGER